MILLSNYSVSLPRLSPYEVMDPAVADFHIVRAAAARSAQCKPEIMTPVRPRLPVDLLAPGGRDTPDQC